MNSESWTIARVLAWSQKDLRARGSESPRLDAELMLAEVLACDRVRLVLDAQRPLDKDELGRYRALHKRRRRGEPVAYLRGYREFYSRRFVVDPRVLVPRPETELLVEAAMRRSRHVSLSARVLDLCTGTGCVAITLKKERPTNTVVGSDVSADALAVARENGVRLGALVAWVEADLFAGLEAQRGRVDVITANPPYIDEAGMAALPRDVKDFEPALALAAGPDGLQFLRAIVQGAPALLAEGGALVVEVGAGQAPAVAGLLESAGYQAVEIDDDYAGHQRIVSARRPR